MATDGSTPPVPFDELLDALRAIEKALKDPASRSLATEVPIEVASSRLDYLAVRELMGRDRRPPDPASTFVFRAKRAALPKNDPHSTITVFAVPEVAAKLAVFTSAGPPAEVVDLPGGVDRSRSGDVDFVLTTVTNDKPIVRLELRRDDDYPVRLGPRLAAV
ncbi:hypothetical protein [Kribbella endophytica]